MSHGICEHCGGCQCCDECACEEYVHTPSGGTFWVIHNLTHDRPYTERDQAVADAAEHASEAMMIALLYGGSPIGIVSGRTAWPDGRQALAITAASWAPGLWQGAVGSKIDVWCSRMVTKRNIHGPLTVTGFEWTDRLVHVSACHPADLVAIGFEDCITPCQAGPTPDMSAIVSGKWATIWL